MFNGNRVTLANKARQRPSGMHRHADPAETGQNGYLAVLNGAVGQKSGLCGGSLLDTVPGAHFTSQALVA